MQENVNKHSVGFQNLSFTIQEITADGFALGVDGFNRNLKIPLTLLPGKGLLPQAGETWLISKALTGTWSLVAIINHPSPPSITGSRSGGTALTNLLTELEDLGLIIDNTTA